MPTDLLKEQIKGLISKDQADKALAHLLDFVRQNTGMEDIERTALINNGQLERLEKDRHEDRITPEQYAIEKNRILSSLLSLIDSLEPVPLTFEPAASPATPASSSSTTAPAATTHYTLHDNIFISVILLLLVSSVVAFFYFTFQAQYGQGGVFFSSASGTCLVYLNWRKKATNLTTHS